MKIKFSCVFKTSIIFLGLFLIGLALWTNRFFGRVTIDQALSTVQFGVNGMVACDSVFIKRFIEWCLVWPGILLLAFLIKPLSKFTLYPFVLLIGIVMVSYQYQLPNFAANIFSHHDDLFSHFYVNPAKINFKSTHPKSLVLIYVESLESTYTNKTLFNRNLLNNLDQATSDGIRFSQFQQLPGTGWTIAAIVATQCGIPFKLLTIMSENRMGENLNHFLPNATCLSDVLAAQGYKNVFMNGPALIFSGVNVFLQDHHYDEAYGKTEWLRDGAKQSDIMPWGLPDDELFKRAKIKLASLIKQKQPFNLTLLTIDTHGVSGQLNPTCKQQGYKQFDGIVECTANEVADFVSYIKKNGWLDRVNIVIVGDHLAMQNDVSDKLKLVESRSIYNVIISQRSLHKNTNRIVHYDMLPTILDSLHIDFPEGKLALGYSAIRQPRAKEPPKRLTKLGDLANRSSSSYNQLWLNKSPPAITSHSSK